MEMEFVRIINMPVCIKAWTTVDEDGNYNIYINARLPQEMQVKALEHEREHIERDDHYSHLPIITIENI